MSGKIHTEGKNHEPESDSCDCGALDAFIKRWWLDRPGPDANPNVVLLHVIQRFLEEKVLAFRRIRLRVE